MPKKGHTEEQIVAVLRQAEAGEKVSELCRKVGISEATYYAWKKQYAGLLYTGRPQCHSSIRTRSSG
jgi:putative transposase